MQKAKSVVYATTLSISQTHKQLQTTLKETHNGSPNDNNQYLIITTSIDQATNSGAETMVHWHCVLLQKLSATS